MKKKLEDNSLLKEIKDRCISEIEDAGPLICYILQKNGEPLDSEILYDIAVTGGLINYFAYQDAIDTLLKSGTIREIPDGQQICYGIADAGEDIAEKFMQMSERSYRDEVLSLSKETAKNSRSQNDVSVTCEPLRSGCYLHVTLKDNTLKLLDLTVFTPDEGQANQLAEQIKENPSVLYHDVIQAVMNFYQKPTTES